MRRSVHSCKPFSFKSLASFLWTITLPQPFSVVGHEGPAAGIDMTLYELVRNPGKQQRLREELIALGREPTYEDLTSSDKLSYLDAVVKEG